MEEITCLLDVSGKDSVKTSVQAPVKGITNMSPVYKPVIKGGTEKRSGLLN